jgi:hypothetical protein
MSSTDSNGVPAAKPSAAPPSSPARRMQASLATALKSDPDWEEF